MSEPVFRFSKVPRRRWTSGGAPEPLVGLLPPPLVRLGLLGAVGRRWEPGPGARGRVPRLGGCGCALEQGGALHWALLLLPARNPVGARFHFGPPLLALRNLRSLYLVGTTDKDASGVGLGSSL